MATQYDPILKDSTGQAIVTKLEGIKNAINPTAENIPITTIEGMEAENVQEGLEELKQSLDVSIIGSTVNIIGYTLSTPYTFPSDGYVILECKYGNHYILCGVASSGNISDAFTIQATGTAGARGRFSLYVKKGMRFYFSQQSEGAEGTAYFRGLS